MNLLKALIGGLIWVALMIFIIKFVGISGGDY